MATSAGDALMGAWSLRRPSLSSLAAQRSSARRRSLSLTAENTTNAPHVDESPSVAARRGTALSTINAAEVNNRSRGPPSDKLTAVTSPVQQRGHIDPTSVPATVVVVLDAEPEAGAVPQRPYMRVVTKTPSTPPRKPLLRLASVGAVDEDRSDARTAEATAVSLFTPPQTDRCETHASDHIEADLRELDVVSPSSAGGDCGTCATKASDSPVPRSPELAAASRKPVTSQQPLPAAQRLHHVPTTLAEVDWHGSRRPTNARSHTASAALRRIGGAFPVIAPTRAAPKAAAGTARAAGASTTDVLPSAPSPQETGVPVAAAIAFALGQRAKQHAATLSMYTAIMTDCLRGFIDGLHAAGANAIAGERRVSQQLRAARSSADATARALLLVQSESFSRSTIAATASDAALEIGAAFSRGMLLISLQLQTRVSHMEDEVDAAKLSMLSTEVKLREAEDDRASTVEAMSALQVQADGLRTELSTLRSVPAATVVVPLEPCRECAVLRVAMHDAHRKHQDEERSLLATIVRKDAELRTARGALAAAEARAIDIARLGPAANAERSIVASASQPTEGISALLRRRPQQALPAATPTPTGSSTREEKLSGTSVVEVTKYAGEPLHTVAVAVAPVVADGKTHVDEQMAAALSRAAAEASLLRTQRDRLADTVRRLLEVQKHNGPPTPTPCGDDGDDKAHRTTTTPRPFLPGAPQSQHLPRVPSHRVTFVTPTH